MSGEPKKISFGFSKVSKKSNIIQPKKDNEIKKDIQFIDCLEEKSIKLVSGEEEKKKELPIIPMRNGNLLRESIKEIVKSREHNKGEEGIINESSKENNGSALTLDELAAKEILEDLKKDENQSSETLNPTVRINSDATFGGEKPSTLEDYENMPISDFGLAMLRGMGWDPKKGIGLNEKLVTPLAPTLRPKGMGLGADKAPTAKNVSSNGEVLIMKKGAPVKIISGLHNNLYGRIEGFDELPGRLMVRITANKLVVSLNEIMVQLVSISEFNKATEQLVDSQTKSENSHGEFESMRPEKKRLNEAEMYEVIHSKDKREKGNAIRDNYKTHLEKKNKDNSRNKNEKKVSRDNPTKNISKESKRYKSSASSSESDSNNKIRSSKKYKSRRKESRYIDHSRRKKEYRRRRSSSSERMRRKNKKLKKKRRCDISSSDSDEDNAKRTRKSKFYSNSSSESNSSDSDTNSRSRNSLKYKKKKSQY